MRKFLIKRRQPQQPRLEGPKPMGLRKTKDLQISHREYHADIGTISEAVKEYLPKVLVGITAGADIKFKLVGANGCDLTDAELQIVITTVLPADGSQP